MRRNCSNSLLRWVCPAERQNEWLLDRQANGGLFGSRVAATGGKAWIRPQAGGRAAKSVRESISAWHRSQVIRTLLVERGKRTVEET